MTALNGMHLYQKVTLVFVVLSLTEGVFRLKVPNFKLSLLFITMYEYTCNLIDFETGQRNLGNPDKNIDGQSKLLHCDQTMTANEGHVPVTQVLRSATGRFGTKSCLASNPKNSYSVDYFAKHSIKETNFPRTEIDF